MIRVVIDGRYRTPPQESIDYTAVPTDEQAGEFIDLFLAWMKNRSKAAAAAKEESE